MPFIEVEITPDPIVVEVRPDGTGEARFQIRLTNSGDVPARDWHLELLLPEGVSVVSGPPGSNVKGRGVTLDGSLTLWPGWEHPAGEVVVAPASDVRFRSALAIAWVVAADQGFSEQRFTVTTRRSTG